MIVSKKVGNAVVRHRVARCIRTAFGMSVLPVVETESFFVRARPSAADRFGRVGRPARLAVRP